MVLLRFGVNSENLEEKKITYTCYHHRKSCKWNVDCWKHGRRISFNKGMSLLQQKETIQYVLGCTFLHQELFPRSGRNLLLWSTAMLWDECMPSWLCDCPASPSIYPWFYSLPDWGKTQKSLQYTQEILTSVLPPVSLACRHHLFCSFQASSCAFFPFPLPTHSSWGLPPFFTDVAIRQGPYLN